MTEPASDRVRRFGRVFFGFLKMDFMQATSYPLAFAMAQVSTLVPLVVYFFVARLVPSTSQTGDYFTYVVVGLFGFTVLSGGLRGFGVQLELSMQYGQFEALLIEPIRWRLLPFAMVQWSLVQGLILGITVLFAGGLFGAEYRLAGLIQTIPLLTLALLASLSVGALSASLLLLAKRSQTVLTLYTLAASVLAGVYFPVALLPQWARLLSLGIPHTYAVEAFRGVLMENPPPLQFTLGQALVALVAFNVLVLPISVWLFGRSLEEGRRQGMLGTY